MLTDYTKEVKESELNLGLDLQGGMHVTLEVSPVDILIGLSSESKDPDFLLAINNARDVVRGTQINFISQFYSEFKSIAPDKDLSMIFATVSNRGRIGFDTSDSEILDIINEEVESAVDRSFNILRTRMIGLEHHSQIFKDYKEQEEYRLNCQVLITLNVLGNFYKA